MIPTSTVTLGRLSLKDYLKIVGQKQIDNIYNLAEKIADRSVVHVNSTSFGGGVAEILHRLVPLMRDIGLDVEWKVITGSDEFFRTTKAFHNALQGMDVALTQDMKKTYLFHNEMNSKKLSFDHDFVVVHDPQPAAIITHYPIRPGKWIWRCHIDLSNPSRGVLDFIMPFISQYDSLIFTMKGYVPKSLRSKDVAIIPPSIDPLSDKNKPLPKDMVLSILEKYDVDVERPIITQVARFDPWKDPLGVIDVYRAVKKEVPGVQLLLVASMAHDDPEGWTFYEKAIRRAGEDSNVHFLTDLVGVKDVEVNAFQRASTVVLLKSLREGFGLSVAEASWKEVPVVGSNVGGIPLQIINGKTGFLVKDIEEATEATLHLLKHPEEARKMGKKGREHVLRNFLITRHLEDYLRLFLKLHFK